MPAKLVVVIRSGYARLGHVFQAGLGALEDVTGLEMEAWQANDNEVVVLACESEGELMRLEILAREMGISSSLVPDVRGFVAIGMGPSAELAQVASVQAVYPQVVPNVSQVVH